MNATTYDGTTSIAAAVAAVLCEMCMKVPSKYCCPSCQIRTCSVTCCIEHKTNHQCDGKRRKTDFVAVKLMDEHLLMSDYRMLEDTLRVVDNAKGRGPSAKQVHVLSNEHSGCGKKSKRIKGGKNAKKCKDLNASTSSNANGLHPYDKVGRFREAPLPNRLRYLLDACRERSIIMDFMPTGMTRRTKNTSFFDMSRKVIKWRVEWTFASAPEPGQLTDPSGVVKNCIIHNEDDISGDEALGKLIDKYTTSDKIDKSVDPALYHGLSVYRNESDLLFCLPRALTPANAPQFYQLDPALSLNENLRDKRIIEYPSIHIIIRRYAADGTPLWSCSYPPASSTEDGGDHELPLAVAEESVQVVDERRIVELSRRGLLDINNEDDDENEDNVDVDDINNNEPLHESKEDKQHEHHEVERVSSEENENVAAEDDHDDDSSDMEEGAPLI